MEKIASGTAAIISALTENKLIMLLLFLAWAGPWALVVYYEERMAERDDMRFNNLADRNSMFEDQREQMADQFVTHIDQKFADVQLAVADTGEDREQLADLIAALEDTIVDEVQTIRDRLSDMRAEITRAQIGTGTE